MEVRDFDWREEIEEKVIAKHGLLPEEVEESFFYPGRKIRGQGDRYLLYSRTSSGGYIMVVFAYRRRRARIITARPMTDRERRYYDGH